MKECTECGCSVEEGSGKICPECGNATFYVNGSASANCEIRCEVRGARVYGPSIGKGRRAHEKYYRTDMNHDRGCEVIVDTEIDRVNDTYREEVTVKDTGEVIHFCSEPLSKHHGRGNAKKKKK